jgi:predicted membrane metal-binding protein
MLSYVAKFMAVAMAMFLYRGLKRKQHREILMSFTLEWLRAEQLVEFIGHSKIISFLFVYIFLYFYFWNFKKNIFLFSGRTEANKYSQEELMLMKTQDTGYVLQKEKGEWFSTFLLCYLTFFATLSCNDHFKCYCLL